MKKKTVKVLLIAGGVLAAIWYFFFRAPSPTSAAGILAAGTSGNTVPSTTVPVDQTDGTGAPIEGSATMVSDPAGSSPSSSGQSEQAVITYWIGTLSAKDQKTMYAALPTMPQSDQDIIYNIIENNLWGNIIQVPLWNAFVAKYHILGH